MNRSALSVDEALQRICADVEPTQGETVLLEEAAGRTLAYPLAATFDQPPFDASAMDGYAVRAEDVKSLPVSLQRIGEAAAGHPFEGSVLQGQAVRIFTGAPLPAGADAIVIQENADADGDTVTIREGVPDSAHVRAKGGDFAKDSIGITAGTLLDARHLAFAAAMGHRKLSVHRKPRVAILATGDELVEPGITPGPGQIVASNSYAVAAMVTAAGGAPTILGIATDTADSLALHVEEAREADLLITIGGASVGEHDLVRQSLTDAGYQLDFWKIAMRPGKPLMFAIRDRHRAIGLPGNPVSSIVCTRIFVMPLIAAMCRRNLHMPESIAILATGLAANGPRQHYMRATLETSADGGLPHVVPATSQDSSLQSILAASNALIVRKPGAPALKAGEKVTVLPIDF